MKSFDEYKALKNKYISENNIGRDNVYDFFNETQIKILQRYYEVYSKYLYNSLVGNLQLNVLPDKLEKLKELKGEGDWVFAGMIDMRVRGTATCELGHPLRYVYQALNTKNNEKLFFGSNCVSDFFMLSKKNIMVLEKLKTIMFEELKDMVAIKSLNLYKEHYMYDCQEFGSLLLNLGVDKLENIKEFGGLQRIVNDFYKYSLPFPSSLREQILRFKKELKGILEDKRNWGIDLMGLEELQKSNIPLVSLVFTYSEGDIVQNLLKNENQKSDFYNYESIDDLRDAIFKWKKYNNKLKDIDDYFSSRLGDIDWVEIYKKMVSIGYHKDIANLYYATEILILFNKNITPSYNFYYPRMYSYKRFAISQTAIEKFEDLLDYIFTKDYFLYIQEIQNILSEEKNEKDKELKKIEDMMNYLKENLMDNKYSSIRGIVGVQDIVCNKKKEYAEMSEKQQLYVEGIYKAMKKLDKDLIEKQKDDNFIDKNINNRYTLVEKSDILAKIQRLQSEVPDKLNEKTLSIIRTIMSTKFVSDRQILRINEAFDKYILRKEINDSESVSEGKKRVTNRVWNLIERPDVKEKIKKIQSLSDYYDIPEGVRNILGNILKYNSASDSQITTVERTYNRYFRGV